MTFYWKTLAGRCIYRSDDGLSVHQNALYRWLVFNNQTDTLQSLIHRHFPHKPGLRYLIPFTYALRTTPEAACLLGLGGAGVAHYVAPYLRLHPLTAIEKNTQVIQLASQYFMTHTLKNLTIDAQDAQQFVMQYPSDYQHILIDVYTAQGFPNSCHSIDFFAACKRILRPTGILALNLPDFHYNLRVFQHVRAVFQHATVCIPISSSSNMVVLAAHSTHVLHTLLYTKPRLKKFLWDSELGYMARF